MTQSTGSTDPRFFAFDIDGTLADTRALVKESYRLAGVDMPDHVWGQPWKSWLMQKMSAADAVRAHERKSDAYLKLIKTRPPRKLPSVAIAQRLIRDGHEVIFVTGASSRAAIAILEQCQLSTRLLAGYSCTNTEKIEILSGYGVRGLWVDDDLRAGQIVAKSSGFDFLHATHTDARRMMEDVQTWMQ